MAPAKYNAANERTKRAYFAYLKEARRCTEVSLSGVAKALARFEEYTRYKDFRSFHIEQAIGFKRRLAEGQNIRTGERLSKATLYSTLQNLRNFFVWLAGRPGFKSRLSYADADYFNLSDNETRIAKARREQIAPTLEQIHHVLNSMPHGTNIDRRNRAVIAFALLTGARDGAIASIKLKHVDLTQGRIIQDAREVKTKFSKTFPTWFFPVGGNALQILTDWVGELSKLLWGPSDPLFPATHVSVGSTQHFKATGLVRRNWSSTAPIRAIFRQAFTSAGLPYFNPHSFRRTLAQLGERLCSTPEEFKAWSQNLGHDQVLTTFSSYGTVAPSRQADIIRALGTAAAPRPNLVELFSRIVEAEATKYLPVVRTEVVNEVGHQD
jgi:integrase